MLANPARTPTSGQPLIAPVQRAIGGSVPRIETPHYGENPAMRRKPRDNERQRARRELAQTLGMAPDSAEYRQLMALIYALWVEGDTPEALTRKASDLVVCLFWDADHAEQSQRIEHATHAAHYVATYAASLPIPNDPGRLRHCRESIERQSAEARAQQQAAESELLALATQHQ